MSNFKKCESNVEHEISTSNCSGKNRKAKYRIFYLTGQDINGEPYEEDYIDVCKKCKNDDFTDEDGNSIEEILRIERIN